MSPPAPSELNGELRFGLFELDPQAEELRKAGVRIKIQGQPFRILLYLARRPGEIVSREELHRNFWKADSAVDLDRSLAAAIYKIRECLDDSVTNPRFVETISRSGYRFIAPVAEIRPDSSREAAGAETVGSPGTTPSSEAIAAPAANPTSRPTVIVAPSSLLTFGKWLAACAAVALLISAAILLPRPRSGAAAIRAITHNASVSYAGPMSWSFPGAVIDNSRIYFPQHKDCCRDLAVVMVNGGDTTTIALPEELGSPLVDDVSPDGLQLLLQNQLSPAAEQALWVASPAGQTARQVPGVLAHDSVWTPRGDAILYANGDSLYMVHDNGSGNRRLATMPGRPFRMRFSPDGTLLRLTLRDDRTLDTTLWELKADGSGAHQILARWHGGEPVCCGTFLNGGDLYVFQAGDERSGSLWAVPVRPILGARREPFRLAEGPLAYTSPVATRNGRGVIFTGFAPSFHLLDWSATDRRLLPAPIFLNDAERIELSPDRQWVTWVRRDDGSLWRSRTDGTDRVRLIGDPYTVSAAAWSPDGARLAVMARRSDSPWRIFLVEANSGRKDELLPSDLHNQADPQWAPDGAAIIFGRLPEFLAEPSLRRALYRVDVATRKIAIVPGSEGLIEPRVSPDHRTLVALDATQTKVRELDFASGVWTTAATGDFEDVVFLPDGRTLVYRDPSEPGIALRSLNLDTRQTKPFAEGLKDEPGIDSASFAGLLANDDPLISEPRESAELYELEVPE